MPKYENLLKTDVNCNIICMSAHRLISFYVGVAALFTTIIPHETAVVKRLTEYIPARGSYKFRLDRPLFLQYAQTKRKGCIK